MLVAQVRQLPAAAGDNCGKVELRDVAIEGCAFRLRSIPEVTASKANQQFARNPSGVSNNRH